jgi:hypothetical protein
MRPVGKVSIVYKPPQQKGGLMDATKRPGRRILLQVWRLREKGDHQWYNLIQIGVI